jgi:hypothetical protein
MLYIRSSFRDAYKIGKYSVGRMYSLWMLKPVGESSNG